MVFPLLSHALISNTCSLDPFTMAECPSTTAPSESATPVTPLNPPLLSKRKFQPDMSKEEQLEFLLQVNEEFFRQELANVVSIIIVLPVGCLIVWILQDCGLVTVLISVLPSQGFTQLELTPLQAVEVLQRCEHRMGTKIPKADLDAGRLGQYLRPEDYRPLQDVSGILLTS